MQLLERLLAAGVLRAAPAAPPLPSLDFTPVLADLPRPAPADWLTSATLYTPGPVLWAEYGAGGAIAGGVGAFGPATGYLWTYEPLPASDGWRDVLPARLAAHAAVPGAAQPALSRAPRAAVAGAPPAGLALVDVLLATAAGYARAVFGLYLDARRRALPHLACACAPATLAELRVLYPLVAALGQINAGRRQLVALPPAPGPVAQRAYTLAPATWPPAAAGPLALRRN